MSKIYIAKLCMVKKYGLLADLAYITKGNRVIKMNFSRNQTSNESKKVQQNLYNINRVITDEILNSELLRNV